MSPDIVYQILLGQVDLDHLVVPANVEIANMFAKGTACTSLYGEMYKARVRLENRLGTADDADVQRVIECMEEMNRYLAKEMYRIGSLYGQVEKKRILIPLPKKEKNIENNYKIRMNGNCTKEVNTDEI